MNDYERIGDILRFLDDRHTDQPDLDTLAEHAGLSKFNFNRLFSRWAGITPKDFLQCLTLAHTQKMCGTAKAYSMPHWTLVCPDQVACMTSV